MNNFISRLNDIYTKLLDDESRSAFDARVEYLVTKDVDVFLNHLCKADDAWECGYVENALHKTNAQSVIIYGCGCYGKRSKKVLELCGYTISCFIDSDRRKWGTEVDGVKVISLNELKDFPNSVIVVAGLSGYQSQMIKALVERNVETERIIIPIGGYVSATRGRQYFDIFEPKENEVYVDAGTFNGGTVLGFEEWTNGLYEKVYAMEPLPDMFKYIKEKFSDKANVEVYNCAAWNEENTLSFLDNSSGSAVNDDGTLQVNAMAIDDMVKDAKVTYIKMDIEGSELKALEGARKTIQHNKPRLAICIYHKPLDMIEIPEYLSKLVPEYKFYVRHYCTNNWETVLYAVLED